mmetsp:Transcript_3049/g.7749  ORF Transcript_3049/g.7749 Transcript_3049/m.7749 type:complete len:105 (+) Transcript_3049:1066-1380(+)
MVSDLQVPSPAACPTRRPWSVPELVEGLTVTQAAQPVRERVSARHQRWSHLEPPLLDVHLPQPSRARVRTMMRRVVLTAEGEAGGHAMFEGFMSHDMSGAVAYK